MSSKRKEFFVDTKTTCFLCLMEITPVVCPGDDDEETKEPEKQGGGTKFCMRSIFRYLKMNPGLVFRKQLTGSLLDTTKLLNKIADWSVLLCQGCFSLATQLSGMCSELELLQMKVNHSLFLVQETIDKSDKDTMKMDNFRGNMINPLDILEKTIANLLRLQLQQKCCNHNKIFMPTVYVNKWKNIATSIPGPPTTTVSLMMSPPVPPPPQRTTLLFPITPKTLMKPAKCKCAVCGSAFNSFSGLTRHISKRHAKHDFTAMRQNIFSESRFKCHPCSSSFPNVGMLRQHKYKHHPAGGISYPCTACGLKLLTKPDHIRHTRLYCHQRPTNTTSSFGRIQIKVEIPPPPVSPQEGSMIVIPETGMTVDLGALIKCLPHYKTVNNGSICSLCEPNNIIGGGGSKVFWKEEHFRTHLYAKHLDYFFGPVKLQEVTPTQFKVDCDLCVQAAMKITTNGPISYKNVFNCLHCTRVYSKPLNKHLVDEHYSVIASKLIEMQRRKPTKEADEPACLVSPPPPTPPTNIQVFSHQTTNPEKILTRSQTRSQTSSHITFVCDYCDKTFPSNPYKIRHMHMRHKYKEAKKNCQRNTCDITEKLPTQATSPIETSDIFVTSTFSLSAPPTIDNKLNCNVDPIDGKVKSEQPQNYFFEEEQEEEEEVCLDSYANTKIEVLEMDQVQMCYSISDGDEGE